MRRTNNVYWPRVRLGHRTDLTRTATATQRRRISGTPHGSLPRPRSLLHSQYSPHMCRPLAVTCQHDSQGQARVAPAPGLVGQARLLSPSTHLDLILDARPTVAASRVPVVYLGHARSRSLAEPGQVDLVVPDTVPEITRILPEPPRRLGHVPSGLS